MWYISLMGQKRHHDTISIRIRRPSYAILRGLAARDGNSIVDELEALLQAEADRYKKAWIDALSMTRLDLSVEKEGTDNASTCQDRESETAHPQSELSGTPHPASVRR